MHVYEPGDDSFLLQEYVKKYARGLVLDMGTGSGIQAVTAASSADFVVALDVNKDAIKYCLKEHKNVDNILFFKSNMFQAFDENFFYYDFVDRDVTVYPKKKVTDKEKLAVLSKKQIKFDLIVFNPPYLPQELEERDVALEGGEEGWEVLYEFFNAVSQYLALDGRILIVFSSFTKQQRVNDIIHKAGFSYIELKKKHVFFEDLIVYYVTKASQ